MSVRWGCSISSVFYVTNGVRQGGMLSPKLFNIYIDGLSNILNNSIIGSSFIVSLSSAGLQKLLSICDDYCASHSITFNGIVWYGNNLFDITKIHNIFK